MISLCHELMRQILAKGNFIITDDYFVILGVVSEEFVNKMRSMSKEEVWLNLLREILSDNCSKDILVVLKIYGKLNVREILRGVKDFRKIMKGVLYFDRNDDWKFINWTQEKRGGENRWVGY